jgi:hypothetical protein
MVFSEAWYFSRLHSTEVRRAAGMILDIPCFWPWYFQTFLYSLTPFRVDAEIPFSAISNGFWEPAMRSLRPEYRAAVGGR